MPRSRGSSEMQAGGGGGGQLKQSPRAPLHLRSTACSESNAVHSHHNHQRGSPKVEVDRRSPRSPLHEGFGQKKRGIRVADLETKLNQAHEELKMVKERLVSTEQQLQEFKKDPPMIRKAEQRETEETEEEVEVEKKPQDQEPLQEIKSEPAAINEDLPEKENDETVAAEEGANLVTSPATDVYEVVPSSAVVPIGSDPIKSEIDNEKENVEEKEEEETKAMIEEAEKKEEESKDAVETPESPEVVELKAKLGEWEKEMEIHLAEKETLEKKASEASAEMAAAKTKEEEMGLKVVSLGEELKKSQAETEQLKEKLASTEAAQAALEAEMRRLRVQTDQWRKAAETAAAVLANGDGADGNGVGRRVGERCVSMDKHHQIGNGLYGINGGGMVGFGSPLMGEEMEEELGSRKRSGSGGMRMFGDLWKKRSQQK